MRKCVGCNISKAKEELIRISFYKEEIKIDIDGKAKGRGVYVCKNHECLEKAIKRKGFIRAFGKNLSEEQQDILFKELDENEKN